MDYNGTRVCYIEGVDDFDDKSLTEEQRPEPDSGGSDIDGEDELYIDNGVEDDDDEVYREEEEESAVLAKNKGVKGKHSTPSTLQKSRAKKGKIVNTPNSNRAQPGSRNGKASSDRSPRAATKSSSEHQPDSGSNSTSSSTSNSASVPASDSTSNSASISASVPANVPASISASISAGISAGTNETQSKSGTEATSQNQSANATDSSATSAESPPATASLPSKSES